MDMVIIYEPKRYVIAKKTLIEYPIFCFSQLGDFPSFFSFTKRLFNFLIIKKTCGGFGGDFRMTKILRGFWGGFLTKIYFCGGPPRGFWGGFFGQKNPRGFAGVAGFFCGESTSALQLSI